MSLTNFESWKSMQEVQSGLAGDVGKPMQSVSPSGAMLGAAKLGFSAVGKEPADKGKDIKSAIMRGLSGLSGSTVMKAMPLLMDLQQQPEKLRAKAIARMAGSIGVSPEMITQAKAEIGRVDKLLQR
jgi:hypothetical protein